MKSFLWEGNTEEALPPGDVGTMGWRPMVTLLGTCACVLWGQLGVAVTLSGEVPVLLAALRNQSSQWPQVKSRHEHIYMLCRTFLP